MKIVLRKSGNSIEIACAIIPVHVDNGSEMVVRPIHISDGLKWQPMAELVGKNVPEEGGVYSSWRYDGKDLRVSCGDYFVKQAVSGVFTTLEPYNVLGWLVIGENASWLHIDAPSHPNYTIRTILYGLHVSNLVQHLNLKGELK